MSWHADLGRLLDAIEHAEGGHDALIRAIQCSFPNVTDYQEARKIAETTVLHALWDYAMEESPLVACRNEGNFIAFLGARWAPVGAKNDPHNLNANWVANVVAAYTRPLPPSG